MPNLRLMITRRIAHSLTATSEWQQPPGHRRQSAPEIPMASFRKLRYLSTDDPELLEAIEAPNLVALVMVGDCAYCDGLAE